MATQKPIPQQAIDWLNKNSMKYTLKQLVQLTGLSEKRIQQLCEERSFKLQATGPKKYFLEKTKTPERIEKTKVVKRVRGDYNNISSPYGIASDLHNS